MAVNTLDKYFTPSYLVKHTIEKALEVIGKENITDMIEPSAGDGAFIEDLDTLANELNIKVSYYDLYPEHERIIQQDFKTLKMSYKKGRLIIGNPPYGSSSSLWKAFCKKSATIGDYVVFISPASQYNCNYYFKEGRLVYSELLNDVEYYGSKNYDGKDVKVRTCLNIYKVEENYDVDPRDEMLDKIVKVGGTSNKEPHIYQYYLADATNGRTGRLCNKEDYACLIGITILDENYHDKIYSFLQDFNKNYEKEIKLKSGMPFITNPFFKDKLKKFLWPIDDQTTFNYTPPVSIERAVVAKPLF